MEGKSEVGMRNGTSAFHPLVSASGLGILGAPPMFRRLLLPALLLLSAAAGRAEADAPVIDQAPHDYWQQALGDRFTKLKTEVEAGRVVLDGSGEKPFLLSLLKALEVPVTSQMLVFSTTSLQLRFITPANPRALYFNEDTYVGYIPGGKLEIVSIDPALGGIFYILDIPRGAEPFRAERSNRCMNCHAAEDTGHVPGLVIKSVLPGVRGGSLETFRQSLTGHAVPLKDRFGGWYLTGAERLGPHLGNVFGQYSPAGDLQKVALAPGSQFDYARYPVATTDVLPQLLHEHQVGFVNRPVAATSRTRDLVAQGMATDAVLTELDTLARALTRYLLFADEVPLPRGAVVGDPAYKADFLRTRRPDARGVALKDFDLQTRLFRYRCSYMMYGAAFTGLPPEMKQRVSNRLWQALNVTRPDPEYAYLAPLEKQNIHAVLRATLRDLPQGW